MPINSLLNYELVWILFVDSKEISTIESNRMEPRSVKIEENQSRIRIEQHVNTPACMLSPASDSPLAHTHDLQERENFPAVASV